MTRRPPEALYDAMEALERRLRPQVAAPTGQAGRRGPLRSPRLARLPRHRSLCEVARAVRMPLCVHQCGADGRTQVLLV